jgi:pantetheine-phosphate adenylyltransferase
MNHDLKSKIYNPKSKLRPVAVANLSWAGLYCIYMYKTIFLGGTFDTLHKGHISLLTRAFDVGGLVTIGLTSDAFVGKFKKGPYKPFSDREKAISDWLAANSLTDRSAIVPIDNPYEPAATGAYSAIMVTGENRFRGEEINAIRLGRGLPPLELIDIPLVSAEDGLPISSSRIREGQIDNSGHLVMPELMRQELKLPFGSVLSEAEIAGLAAGLKNKVVVTVGDITTSNLMHLGIVPNLAIIDLFAKRVPFQTLEQYHFPANSRIVNVKSGPGYIAQAAVDAIKNWGNTADKNAPTVIVVDGEEDLLTLPSIVYTPIDSVVFYGQPEMPDTPDNKNIPGLVEVLVDQHTKEKAMELVNKFE